MRKVVLIALMVPVCGGMPACNKPKKKGADLTGPAKAMDAVMATVAGRPRAAPRTRPKPRPATAPSKSIRRLIARNAAARGDVEEAFRRAADLPIHDGVLTMIGIAETALQRGDRKSLHTAITGVRKLATKAQTSNSLVWALIRYVEIAGRAGMRSEALAKAKLAKSAFKNAPSFRQSNMRDLASSLGRGGMKKEAKKLLERLARELKSKDIGFSDDLMAIAIAAAKAGLAPLARSIHTRAKQAAVKWEKMLSKAIIIPLRMVKLHLHLDELETSLKKSAKLEVRFQVYLSGSTYGATPSDA